MERIDIENDYTQRRGELVPLSELINDYLIGEMLRMEEERRYVQNTILKIVLFWIVILVLIMLMIL